MTINVKNLRTDKMENPWDIRVDRQSPLGNPFIMRKESERDMVCDRYESWFYTKLYDSTIQEELLILKNILLKYGKINLFCWCIPKRCHAETIKRYLLTIQN